MKPLVLCLTLVTLTGCISQPQLYAPPIQREPMLDGKAPTPPKDMVRMSDGDTDSYIVQDIPKGSTDPWRWTGKRPTVRLFVAEPGGRKLVVDYTIAEATFKDTGPVALTFFINDKPLDTVKETRSGVKHFEKPVPAAMFKPNAGNIFAIEIDKVWIAPADGAHLGFMLSGVGLIR